MLLNATCFCRAGLLVVLPHSMSMVPLASSGMRVEPVTGVSVTLRPGMSRRVFSASTTFMQMSMAKPTGFWSSSR